jgi:ubiquinone/menaquinone biosynthesis C-methylase UbiE
MSQTASTSRLERFYGEMSSLERILQALSSEGLDVERMRASDLYTRGLDLHNLGALPMLELQASAAAEYGNLGPEDTLLDIGCGLGGPGRYLADRHGCTVVGIDVLPLRIDIAQELTRRTGLAGRVSHRVANATDLPLDDAAFTQSWMLDVSMHIRDKKTLFSEIARVLRPGGLLVMHDQLAPLPRAMRPVTLRAPYIAPSLVQLIRYVEDAGLRVLTWRDTTERALEYFERLKAALPDPNSVPAALDGYIETLAHLDGRTGLLIARRRRL